VLALQEEPAEVTDIINSIAHREYTFRYPITLSSGAEYRWVSSPAGTGLLTVQKIRRADNKP